ncbi:phytoene dehydrogenase-like protein [Antricoccus suffuscus]|uniref:Phytoene dehydrogenase-like protein n=1 Tax=Antricoccus suffuscus TaxID=1629062 RepID=A0A2T0ZYG8_9ACTN|nr:NAD(P)/FAD-dependent oxidoreductase [Antricoccus suffuscus]PRZ41396.1 phytoene dehydrogenase-like protein [Antricoccus suffuscus]
MSGRDVVIVGAGHNALVTGCYLARSGLNVEIVEQDAVVGGAVSTVERFPGVLMDRGSSAHIMIRHTGIVEDLDLAAHGLIYQDMDPWGFAPIRADDGTPDALVFWVDIERTCESIAAVCGMADADAYRRFTRDWLPRNEVVFDFFQQSPTPAHLARAMAGLRKASRSGVAQMSREFLGSADAVLDSYFHDERLKTALAWMAAQSGPPSHEPATADLVGWLTMMHRIAPGHPVGGSGKLSEALASCFASYGGTLRLGDGAAEISCRAGKVRSVTTTSGDQIQARQVVAGCHVQTTATLIEGTAPKVTAELRGNARTGNGLGMVVRAVTDTLPGYLADEAGIAHHAMTLLADSRVELRRNYGEFLAGRAPTNPAALVMAPSGRDDTLAPAGRHTVTIWGQWHAYHLEGESWHDIADREAAKLVEVVERHAPGFADSVQDLWVQTPLEIERELGLLRGNVMHLEMTLDQMFSLRPVPKYADYRISDVDGLYITGASTHPGGGVFGASGRSAAHAVLADRSSVLGRLLDWSNATGLRHK